MNRILFPPWLVEHKVVSSVLRYARPHFHRLFCPSRFTPDEHDHTFRFDPAGCLPLNTTTTQLLRSNTAMYTSPGHTYARVGVRDPARMYVRGHIFFLAPWPLYVRVHAMCAPLLRHKPFLTRPWFITAVCRQTDCMYVHVRDRNDNATYASTRSVPTLRHFLACEDVVAGTHQLHLRTQGSA